jgi:glycerol-3-phosphate dehydrogenase
MASISEFRERPYQCPDRIGANPEYGRIVCFCEKVSEQEIRDALASPIPARSLGALKRRTRATMGRCQGFNCLPAVLKALAAAHGLTLREYFDRENAGKETI